MFKGSGFSAISYANGFTLWHYRTSDDLAAVLDKGYFAPACKMLRVGDFIMCNASTDAVALEHAMLVVVAATSTDVQVVRMVAAP